MSEIARDEFVVKGPPAPSGRTGGRSLWSRRWVARVAILTGAAVIAQVLQVVLPGGGGPAWIDLERPEARSASVTPSGADPAYPLNHTFDGKYEDLGSFANADFETPPYEVGTPPQNHDLEAPPAVVAAPTNGDFETGDFTGWTSEGTPFVDSDAEHGSFSVLNSTGEAIRSDPVTVPSGDPILSYDVGYLSTSTYSWVDVYVDYGTDYSQWTRVKRDYCNGCGSWSSSSVDLSQWAGQSVRLRFRQYWGWVGVDDVRFEEPLPGFDLIGSEFQRQDAGGDTVVKSWGAQIITSAFTVDAATQYATVDFKGSSTSAQHDVYVAAGPDFSTWTRIHIGYADTTWKTLKLNLGQWQGQQVKLKIDPWWGTLWYDDIGVQLVEIPDWSISGAYLKTEASGNHYVSAGSVTSDPLSLPANAQNLTLRARSAGDSTNFYIELLTGANYDNVVQLDYLSVGSTWEDLAYGVGPYAGDSVKLRVRKWVGSSLHLDDVGFLESHVPGWGLNWDGPVATGEDANGTWAGPVGTGSVWLRSAPVDTGIIDRPTLSDTRYYTVSYDIGYSTDNDIKVFWVNDQGGESTVYYDYASSPTGLRTAHFPVRDNVGTSGHFVVRLLGGGKVYAIGDNVAREHAGDPFSRDVGAGIDTSTGDFAFSDTDASAAGPIPLSFSRYFNAHSDAFGPLGYRWSHSYDTRAVIDAGSSGDVGVVFGSGREEFFERDPFDGTYSALDARVHSTLVKNADGSFTLTTKENLDYDFDASGVLQSVTDLNGNTVTLAYDASGNLSTVTGAGGATLTLAYDVNGRLSTLTDPIGAVWTYGYDAAGDLVSVTDPGGAVRSYAYDAHRLTSVVDENGGTELANTYDAAHRVTAQTDALANTISIAYETPGKGVTEVTDPEGGVARFHYDIYGRTTDAIDPEGHIVSYLYDGEGDLSKVIDPANNQWDFAWAVEGDLLSTSDPLGNPISFTYNAEHLPTTVTDARGNVTTLAYDGQGNVSSLTDPLGNATTYTYDSSGNLLTETAPLANTWTYTYDAQGNQTSKTDPLGNTWTKTYDGAGRLTSETDPETNTTTYTRDLLGRVIQITDAENHTTSYLYDGPGHLLMVQDPLGNQTTWAYDDRGLATTKTDAAGNAWTYAYDANRRMTSKTDPLGNTTTWGYDAAGNLTSETDPAGNTTSYAYDAAGRLSLENDPLGRATAYGYDAEGNLTGLTLPNGAQIAYAYDADGNLTSTTDQLLNTTTNAYDANSQLASTTDPLGNATSYTYDAAGRRTHVTDPQGGISVSSFDDAGRLTATADPSGAATSYTYDGAGRLTSVADPTTRTTGYTYDGNGNTLSVADHAGNTTTNTYDAAGNLATATDPTGAVTSYAYDARGLLASVTDPLLNSTGYGYDAAGRRTSVTDARGFATGYSYNAAGWVTQMTDALGGTVSYGYDAAGQRTRLTDANGATWTYGYDTLGNRSSSTDPLDRTWAYSYDAAGQLTSRTDAAGQAVTYSYDANGRQTQVASPSETVTYGYDSLGRRTQMVDGHGTTTYSHDAAGRTTQVASPEGTIGYGYDPAGRRASMTLPGAREVDYGYDPAGNLTSLTDWNADVVGFGHDAAGRRTSVTRANGVGSAYGYDAAGNLSSVTHSDAAGPLLEYAYTYDGSGNRTSVSSGADTESYTIDELGRLTSVTYPDGTTTAYSYDAAGNRLSETTGTTTTNYGYDTAGQLSSVDADTVTHDANGNVTAVGSDTFAYDDHNRLVGAAVDTTTATYTYDGDGTKVSSTVDGNTDPLLNDTVGGLETIVDNGNAAYLHAGAGGFVGVVDGADATYALDDALGSVRGLAGPTGSLVGTADYDAFGEVRASAGASAKFGYTGEPGDATGLTYLRARHYDPALGRMLTADTVRPNAPGTQGHNLYTYVANNPTTWVDPTGHVAAAVGLAAPANPIVVLVVLMLAPVIFGGQWPTADGSGVAGLGQTTAIAFGVLALVFACTLIVACMATLSTYGGLVGALGALTVAGVIAWNLHDLTTAADDHPGEPDQDAERRGQCSQTIQLTEEGLRHIHENHTWHGLSRRAAAGKQRRMPTTSVFYDDVDVVGLIRAAEPTPAFLSGANCVRTTHAPSEVGVDASSSVFHPFRTSPQGTSEYSVVTQPNGDLVTAHPGSAFLH